MAQGEGQWACRGCEEQSFGSTGEGIMVCDSCPTSTWTKSNKKEKEVITIKDTGIKRPLSTSNGDFLGNGSKMATSLLLSNWKR